MKTPDKPKADSFIPKLKQIAETFFPDELTQKEFLENFIKAELVSLECDYEHLPAYGDIYGVLSPFNPVQVSLRARLEHLKPLPSSLDLFKKWSPNLKSITASTEPGPRFFTELLIEREHFSDKLPMPGDTEFV